MTEKTIIRWEKYSEKIRMVGIKKFACKNAMGELEKIVYALSLFCERKVHFAMISETSQQRTFTFAYVAYVAKVLLCDYLRFPSPASLNTPKLKADRLKTRTNLEEEYGPLS